MQIGQFWNSCQNFASDGFADRILKKSGLRIIIKLAPFKICTRSRICCIHFSILDKSSFGYVAGLYNPNTVIYNPYWDKQYSKWILKEDFINT